MNNSRKSPPSIKLMLAMIISLASASCAFVFPFLDKPAMDMESVEILKKKAVNKAEFIIENADSLKAYIHITRSMICTHYDLGYSEIHSPYLPQQFDSGQSLGRLAGVHIPTGTKPSYPGFEFLDKQQRSDYDFYIEISNEWQDRSRVKAWWMPSSEITEEWLKATASGKNDCYETVMRAKRKAYMGSVPTGGGMTS